MDNTISIENTTLEYFSFGEGKRNFVILPGLATRSILFSAMPIASAYRAFTKDFTVWVIDRVKEPEGFTMRDFARHTATALKQLGVENADVFGASMGGMIALYLAIDHPELVHSLVLGSTAARRNPTAEKAIGGWADAANVQTLQALTGDMITRLYGAETLRQYGDALLRINDGLTDRELRRFRVQAKAITTFDAYDELPKIQCPAFVIGVEGDKVLSAEASDELADALCCDQYMYPATYGHCAFDEAPDYKERILKWLASNLTVGATIGRP